MPGLLSAEPDLWLLYPVPNLLHVAFSGCVVISAMYYFHRRELFPLKGRGSREIFTLVGLYELSALSVAARSRYWLCVCDLVTTAIATYCAFAVYCYRIIVLLARHDVANELKFGITSRKRKKYCGERCCLAVHFHVMLVLLGLVVGAFYFCLAWLLGDNYHCRGIGGYASNGAIAVIALPVCIYLGCRLRKAPADGRQIYMEFRLMALWMVVLGLVMVLFVTNSSAPVSLLLAVDLMGMGFMCTGMLFPIYLSYGHQMAEGQSAQRQPVKFEDLARSEAFLEAFLLHLKREFSAEGLVFWKGVTSFKAKGARPVMEMTRDVQEIFDTYVAPSAPFPLNISLDTITDTSTRIEQAKATGNGFLEVFDKLTTEVVALLKSDPLPRFLNSPEGRKFGPLDSSVRF